MSNTGERTVSGRCVKGSPAAQDGSSVVRLQSVQHKTHCLTEYGFIDYAVFKKLDTALKKNIVRNTRHRVDRIFLIGNSVAISNGYDWRNRLDNKTL